MLIYIVIHITCIYEGTYEYLSFWTTKKGAFKARQKVLREAYAEWYEDRLLYGKSKFSFKFMAKEGIRIETQEVFEEGYIFSS